MLHRTFSTCQKNRVKYVSTRISNPLQSAVSSVSNVLLKELSFTIRTLYFGLDNKQWEWNIGRSDRLAESVYISMPADTVINVGMCVGIYRESGDPRRDRPHDPRQCLSLYNPCATADVPSSNRTRFHRKDTSSGWRRKIPSESLKTMIGLVTMSFKMVLQRRRNKRS